MLGAILAAALCLPASAETLRGRLMSAEGGVEGLVVWVEGGESLPAVPHEPRTLVMSQVDKAFSPDTLALRAGDSVSFENIDAVFHNVFSLDKDNAFDLGLYKGSKRFSTDGKREEPASTTRRYPKPGRYSVFCNIHPDMSGRLHVFAHGYFGQADKNGLFTLPAPPSGKRVLVIDGPTLDAPVRREVDFSAASGLVEVPLKARGKGKVPAHTRKDGKPYFRGLTDAEVYP